MEKTEKIRQSWVDIAKGVAIIAVVLGHITYQYPKWLLLPLSDLLVWLWHVPVFFLIGGFFIKEEKLLKPKEFIYGKFKSVYMLILYIYLPVLLLHNIFINIGFYDLTMDYDGKYVNYWGTIDLIKKIFAAVFFMGREPILGAMWFVYVLFMALCGLSLISYILKRLIKEDNKYETIRFIILLFLAVFSCTLTKLFDFTIPRGNNTLTAIWLIYIGMLMMQRKHLAFNNKFIALASIIIAWHAASIAGGVKINKNIYESVIMLTISSIACLYVICYFSKMIEHNFMGHALSVVGKNSFYIMGLHFFGFKACSLMLIAIGIDINLAKLTAPAGNSIILLFLYLLCGVLIPLGFMFTFRKVKTVLLRLK